MAYLSRNPDYLKWKKFTSRKGDLYKIIAGINATPPEEWAKGHTFKSGTSRIATSADYEVKKREIEAEKEADAPQESEPLPVAVEPLPEPEPAAPAALEPEPLPPPAAASETDPHTEIEPPFVREDFLSTWGDKLQTFKDLLAKIDSYMPRIKELLPLTDISDSAHDVEAQLSYFQEAFKRIIHRIESEKGGNNPSLVDLDLLKQLDEKRGRLFKRLSDLEKAEASLSPETKPTPPPEKPRIPLDTYFALAKNKLVDEFDRERVRKELEDLLARMPASANQKPK